MSVKQVIIIRKDLKMRRGKECSQSSHSSMAWLKSRLAVVWNDKVVINTLFSQDEEDWLYKGQTKITLQVDSEEELMKIYQAAKNAKLEAHKIVDAGKTEFNGVPTLTCIAIGPNKAVEIDKITGYLKLY